MAGVKGNITVNTFHLKLHQASRTLATLHRLPGCHQGTSSYSPPSCPTSIWYTFSTINDTELNWAKVLTCCDGLLRKKNSRCQ